MKLRRFLIPVAILALLGVLALTLVNRDTAPNVSFTTLAGEQIRMEQLQGKIVLVNFWATSCSGCIAEMPKLIDTYNRYHKQGFEIVAVAMSYDPPGNVANYAKSNALPFPVALDPQGEVAAAFNDVKLTPTAFVVDRRGRILRNVVGELDFNALHAMLDEQLGRQS